MRATATRRRGGRVIISLLTGLLVGGFVGGGLVYLFGGKRVPKETVPDAALAKADELALVPADAAGFVHLRVAESWKSGAMAEFRKVVEKAGPDALKALDEGFVPAPSTLNRVTVVLVRPDAPIKVDRPLGKGDGAKNGGAKNDGPKGEGAKGEGQPPKKGKDKGPPVTPPPPPPKPEPVETVVLFAFSAPFDANKVQQVNLPSATKKVGAGGKEYWHEPASDTALYFHSDKLMVLGSGKGVEAFLAKSGRTEGPLAPYLKHAADGTRHVVAGLNFKDPNLADEIRALLPDDAKPYFAPLFRAGAVSGSVVIGEKTRLELRATYADEEEAKKAESDFRSSAEKASKALADPKKKAMEAIKGKGDPGKPRAARELPEAVGGVFALGTLNTIDEFLTNPPLTVEGNELVATVVLPALPEASMQAHAHSISLLFLVFQARPTPFGAGAPGPGAPGPGVPGPKELVPLVPDPKGPKEPKVEPKPDPKEASAREQSLQNLKQLALGMHTFHDKNNTFPAAAIVDEDGKPLLSWRVAILPYIGQEVLYKEFNLKEPWDSENNKKLIEKMPKVFADPRAPADAGKTYYKVFVGPPTGPTAAFDTRYKGRKLVEFLDGASNTVLIVEGGPAVEWTKPEDIRFAPDQKAPELSIGGAGDICLALADGSTRTVKWNKLPENVRKALITPDGAEVLPDDWDR